MIRKLRLKFILTNMALVSLVLIVVFAVLMVSTSQRLAGQSMAAMRMSLEWSDGREPPRFEFSPPGDIIPERWDDRGRDSVRQVMMIPVFCVSLTEDGQVDAVYSQESVSVSDEVLEEAVSQALASGAREGVLNRLGLRYLVETSPEGETRIAFADRSWERQNLQGLLLTSLLVGVGALLGFFLISLFLSRLATRPVAKAWEQQRQFVADASHELKTPLTVILANSGILLSHREDTVAAQAKWVEYIQEEARRMKGLVEDMLFLAKSDAARLSATRLPVDMSELTEGCLLPFESVAFEAGVTLGSDIRPGLCVSGDEGQLRRLVYILLDNACKYAGAGGAVSVTLGRTADRLRLTVRNTGPAIPPEHLEHLFERFYRSDSARTREAGGYGLGLAIAKAIVQSHRGQISVASSEAEGTVFTVLLPQGKRQLSFWG
ncbi:HAMP domain-containing sensor histidine kinase [Pseudoflavonifractor capillosus]|uniref:histidine kinase n=1 Tax=Pseudoflavonifractor capillosus TaxID=106588 RepID=A0A921MMT0_9FIRM|nr:HAMP domain-containing sensor histidine kinase [Pseudoflavonifractor capillosus]HJG87092.1 HAMP domain-containing histidine kinase [Pseudoflavonifractor capillosus]